MSLNTTTLGAGHETIRFRGPAKEKKLDGLGNEMKPKRWIDRHTGLLVDLVRRFVPLLCFMYFDERRGPLDLEGSGSPR